MAEKEAPLSNGKHLSVAPVIHKPSRTRLFLSIISGIIFTTLFLFYATFDVTIPYLKFVSRVANGSALHQFLLKETDMAYYSVYLFNITNAHEFMAGEHDKLKVQEVGPFTYSEIRRNENLEIDSEAGVVRYSPHIDIVFMPEKSVARPEDVVVTMPNIPMLGIASIVNKYGFLVRSGFNILAGQLHSKPILTMDAASYMWGYPEPLVSLGNKVIPGFVSFDKMELLGRLYANDVENNLEVSARDEDKFMIKTRNGYHKLAMGDNQNPDHCDKCSSFEDAYEGMVYPSGLTPNFHLRLFRNGLCKILDMKFIETRAMWYGGKAFVYGVDDSFYYPDTVKNADGNLFLPECFYDMPLSVSRAHFLGMDPKVYEKIEGIHPSEEEHRGYVIIDPKIGMTVDTKISMQINLVLGDVRHNRNTKNFANMVLPICYMKIVQPPLNQESRESLTLLYSLWPKILLIIEVVLALLSILSWAYFVIEIHRYRSKCNKSNGILFPLTGLVKSQMVPIVQPLMENNNVTKS